MTKEQLMWSWVQSTASDKEMDLAVPYISRINIPTEESTQPPLLEIFVQIEPTQMTTPTTIEELCTKHNLKPYCGAGVDDGWIPLLDKLVTDLVASGWNPKDCDQIKEKFGGLRFYVGEATPEQYGMISAAEDLSFKTCEMCSAPGKRQSIKGWLKTVCEQCHEDFLKPTNKG